MKKSTLSGRQKRNLVRIILSLAAFAVIFVVDKTVGLGGVIPGKANWVLPFLLYLAV